MGCGSSSSSSVIAPIPNVPIQKDGHMLYCPSQKGNWKMHHFVLYQDSTISWLSNEGTVLGAVKLKDVAPLIAIGQNCFNVPKRPEIPSGQSINHMMAFPYNYHRGTTRDDIQVNWILFRGEDEMKSWMQALSVVLPPPPQHNQNNQPVTGQHPTPQLPPQQPPPPYQPSANYPPQPQPQPVPYQQPQGYPQAQGYPVQQAYPQQAMYPQQQGYPVCQPQYTTTVVHNQPQYRESRRRGGGADGFATGLILGGALGWGMGRGWGYGYRGWGMGSWSSFGSGGWGSCGSF